jgi:hypothetical protein
MLLLAGAQGIPTPDLEPDAPRGVTPVPTIAFNFALTGADPEHYEIAVEESGRAAYRSVGHATADAPGSAPGTPYMVKFTMSPGATRQIFELAAHAKYFAKPLDYNKGHLANMGAKTLTYSDQKIFYQKNYNYSVMPPVQELTEIFQDIANTLEGGRRLAFAYKYEKLGVDEELKRLEEEARNHQLSEVQAIAPMLQKIAADESVLNIARQRARRLLKISSQESVVGSQ